MTIDHDYILGGVKLRIRAPGPMAADEKWQRFRGTFDVPDLEYRVRRQAQLTLPQQPPLFEDPNVRCYSEKGKALRVYHEQGAAYAVVFEESPSVWYIDILEEKQPWGERIEHLFSQYALPHSLLKRRRLMLHCSYILTDYGAVLFTAPSGTGKSTQAELWRSSRGSLVVNGDRGLISLDGAPLAHGLPISGSSEDCINRTAPLCAVVCLAQGRENRIVPLQGLAALRHIIRGCYLLPEFRGDLAELTELCTVLCSSVPVYHLTCLPEESAVEVLEEQLKKGKYGE